MAFEGALKLSNQDNVATALEDIDGGASVAVRFGEEVTPVKATERIPFGFKVAVASIARGAHVLKYGESIGVASQDIKPGELVHIHNLEGARGRGDLEGGRAK